MLKIIEKQKYPVIALFLGFILVIIGFADVQELQKLKLIVRPNMVYTSVALGSILIIFSFIGFFIEKISIGQFAFGLVRKYEGGFWVRVNETDLNITFGRIEVIAELFPDSVVVLPANEYFDDDCIDDSKSSLGAYINSKFANQIGKVKEIIKQELTSYDGNEVEKEFRSFQLSYGVGKAILIKNILGSTQPVVFLAVTTKRAGEGLKSELSNIHEALKELFAVTADARKDSITLPILGSGHGGLKKELALFGLLMAVLERITSQNGKHIKQINLVIFQESESKNPEIKKSTVKKLLSLSAGMLLK